MFPFQADKWPMCIVSPLPVSRLFLLAVAVFLFIMCWLLLCSGAAARSLVSFFHPQTPSDQYAASWIHWIQIHHGNFCTTSARELYTIRRYKQHCAQVLRQMGLVVVQVTCPQLVNVAWQFRSHVIFSSCIFFISSRWGLYEYHVLVQSSRQEQVRVFIKKFMATLSCIRESISFDLTHKNEELCVPGITRT